MNSQLHIVSKTTDLSHKPDSLLFQLDDNMLGCFLYDKTEKSVYSWQLWQFENHHDLEKIVAESCKSFDHIRSVSVVNYTPRYMSIPADIKQEKDKISFWEVVHGQNPADKILEYHASVHDMMHLHAVVRKNYECIHQYFPNANWFSIQAASLWNINEMNDDVSIKISFFSTYVYVTLINNKKILLSQVYPYGSPEDILWMLLKLVESFGYVSQHISVYPDGLIDTSSAVYQLLDQYFNMVRLANHHKYIMPESDIPLSALTLDHIDSILTCVS